MGNPRVKSHLVIMNRPLYFRYSWDNPMGVCMEKREGEDPTPADAKREGHNPQSVLPEIVPGSYSRKTNQGRVKVALCL